MATETEAGASMHDRAISGLATHLAWVIRVQIGDNPDHSGPEDAAEKLAAAMVEQAENILLTGDWRNLAHPGHGPERMNSSPTARGRNLTS
jgi:hypothetical protein